MRIFKERPFGDEVDLDDPTTYSHLPDDIRSLDDLMFKEIGYALCYMNHYYPDIFNNIEFSGNQKERVENLIKDFLDNRIKNYENINWFKEKVFLFQNEIENMC